MDDQTYVLINAIVEAVGHIDRAISLKQNLTLTHDETAVADVVITIKDEEIYKHVMDLVYGV